MVSKRYASKKVKSFNEEREIKPFYETLTTSEIEDELATSIKLMHELMEDKASTSRRYQVIMLQKIKNLIEVRVKLANLIKKKFLKTQNEIQKKAKNCRKI